MGHCISKPRCGDESMLDATDGNGYLTLRKLRSDQQRWTRTNLAYHSETDGPCQTSTSRHSLFEETDGDCIKAMVEVFRRHLEESVNVHDILPFLRDFIDDEGAIKNRNSNQQSMRCLIDDINKSAKVGKWRAFLNALDEGEYPYIVRLLERHTEKDLSIHKKLLQVFLPELKENIHLDTFLDKLFETRVLSQQDVERIKCEKEKHGETAGCLMLLDCIPNRAENWLGEFTRILRECGMGNIADNLMIDDLAPPSKCSMKKHAASDPFEWMRSTGMETPPPEYHLDRRQMELEQNRTRIKKLNEQLDCNKQLLTQRSSIKELKNLVKESHEKLKGEPPADDSSSETSEKEAVCFELDSGAFSARDGSLEDSPDACADVGPLKFKTQNNGQAHCDVSNETIQLETIFIELRELKHLHNQTIEVMENGFRQINGVLGLPNAPSPHNILTDSAFSDCSISSTIIKGKYSTVRKQNRPRPRPDGSYRGRLIWVDYVCKCIKILLYQVKGRWLLNARLKSCRKRLEELSSWISSCIKVPPVLKISNVSGSHGIVGEPAAEPQPSYAIIKFSGWLLCGGVLVETDMVATTASCVVRSLARNSLFTVTLGAVNRTAPEEGQQHFKVDDIIIHKSYVKNLLEEGSADLALLRLDRKATIIPGVVEVVSHISNSSSDDAIWESGETPCTINGFGFTYFGDSGSYSDVRRAINMYGSSVDMCTGTIFPSTFKKEKQTSSRFKKQTCSRAEMKTTCVGDEGSPLICPDGKGGETLVGLVQYSTCRMMSVIMYTRLSYYSEWIKSHM